MDVASTLENLYHEVMLKECKGEEAVQWENARHEIMAESIIESCKYYALRNCHQEFENEREI